MPALYPLRFHPLLKRYLWGGRRLASVLGKELGPENDYGESWEICDRGDDQSRVANGPWRDVPLGNLVRRHGAEILGRHYPRPGFPLLIKFLDARQNLSMQVHPNDELAARIVPPDNGKTEAWYVLHAEPESAIYAGLRPGVDRGQFERSLCAGGGAELVNRFHPRAGDCIFLPAGAVHALGQGILAAEVQQSSDVTYRLFDWNRLGPDGKPRQLHLERGLEAVDFSRGPIVPQVPLPIEKSPVVRLVHCEKFILDRWQIAAPATIGGDERFHILQPVAGEIRIEGDAETKPLQLGDTCLLPAGWGRAKIIPAGESAFLDIYLP
ncbi:MAG: class I mannose-6-phosphate isomerase [Pirellulales bacterium]|nr:class I mannose-6-phosphate isomerase [Pirellulales bacterium]